jgi:hypothetical protein
MEELQLRKEKAANEHLLHSLLPKYIVNQVLTLVQSNSKDLHSVIAG